MRKFAALGLLVAAGLVATVPFAGASGGSGGDTDTGVQYEWYGDVGTLSIVGEPGDQFEVFDAAGHPVGGGVLDAPHVSFVQGNSGYGPDGTIVFVRVNDEVVAVTDPGWQWD